MALITFKQILSAKYSWHRYVLVMVVKRGVLVESENAAKHPKRCHLEENETEQVRRVNEFNRSVKRGEI